MCCFVFLVSAMPVSGCLSLTHSFWVFVCEEKPEEQERDNFVVGLAAPKRSTTFRVGGNIGEKRGGKEKRAEKRRNSGLVKIKRKEGQGQATPLTPPREAKAPTRCLRAYLEIYFYLFLCFFFFLPPPPPPPPPSCLYRRCQGSQSSTTLLPKK